MDSVGLALASASSGAGHKPEAIFFLSRHIFSFLVAACVLALGLGITFFIYRAQTVITTIDASTPAPSLSPLSLYFIVAGTNPQNFITTDAPGVAFISWRYTTGAAAGNVPFAIAATVAQGTYQLRLYSNDGFTRLATSANFSVSTAKLSFRCERNSFKYRSMSALAPTLSRKRWMISGSMFQQRLTIARWR